MQARHTPVKAAFFAAALLGPGSAGAQVLTPGAVPDDMTCFLFYAVMLRTAPPDLADGLTQGQVRALTAAADAMGADLADPDTLTRLTAELEARGPALLAEMDAASDEAVLDSVMAMLHQCDARYDLPPTPFDWVAAD